MIIIYTAHRFTPYYIKEVKGELDIAIVQKGKFIRFLKISFHAIEKFKKRRMKKPQKHLIRSMNRGVNEM